MNVVILRGNKNGERYDAMAAADLGACQNGVSVLECSAFQLPTVILDNKKFWDSYITMWYNVFDNDINLAEDKQILPEMMGRNFGEKLAELWDNWYKDQNSRYRKAIDTNTTLLKCLPQVG